MTNKPIPESWLTLSDSLEREEAEIAQAQADLATRQERLRLAKLELATNTPVHALARRQRPWLEHISVDTGLAPC